MRQESFKRDLNGWEGLCTASLDNWIGHIVLKDLYPRIYALETCMFVKVGTKLTQSSLDFSFRRKPRGGIEQEQYEALLVQVQDVNLVPVSDRWKWSLENSGDFSVASVRKMLDDKMLPDVTTKTRWIKLVPIKVNVHAWKVKIDSLPTRFNISRRGMDIESITCSICDNEVESSSHLFFKCNMVRDIIRKITRWWDITYIEADSYEDWLNWLVNLRLSSNYEQALEGRKLKEWKKVPYTRPYGEFTGAKKKSKSEHIELEKRALAIVHEFLSLIVDKTMEVEKIS
ncbi:RNA-directed DNA polymerase, eukaryota, partial [Tanacetum coccineum]